MSKASDLLGLVETHIRPLNSSVIVAAYLWPLIATGSSKRSKAIRQRGVRALSSDVLREMTCVALLTAQASHLTVGMPCIRTPRVLATSFSRASGPRWPALRCQRLASAVRSGKGSLDGLSGRCGCGTGACVAAGMAAGMAAGVAAGMAAGVAAGMATGMAAAWLRAWPQAWPRAWPYHLGFG